MGNLRRYMKLTFFTFGIGWLAIAGIPPLSGFFAKGDVLDNAFARYPALWAIGLVTAALTAYYMTRLVGPGLLRRRPLARRRVGRRRRTPRPTARDGRRPHESPVGDGTAAGGAGRAGLRRRGCSTCPGTSSCDPLGGWRPCSGTALYDAAPVGGHAVDAGHRRRRGGRGRPGGVGFACGRGAPSARARAGRAAAVPTTSTTSTTPSSAGPGEAFARFCATVIEAKVIDGAVNGVGRLARAAGGSLRKSRPATCASTRWASCSGAVALLA